MRYDVPAAALDGGDGSGGVGEGEGNDGDRGAGGGAELPGSADLAVRADPEGDPGRAGKRGVPQGRRELHPPPPPGLPRGGGLGDNREAHRLRPGRGAYRGGPGRAQAHL